MPATVIELPNDLQFTYKGTYNFARPLALFDWSIRDTEVIIRFGRCNQANYQALSLCVLYIWHLKVNNNCHIKMYYGNDRWGATKMWRLMGANRNLFNILNNKDWNFRSNPNKPLFAVRNNSDFRDVLRRAEKYTEDFDVEYDKTLRYVLSELLYNTLEHGKRYYIPSIAQFSWYRYKDEISFIVADLGVGIKAHLRQAYPGIEDDERAIRMALQPRVSGTFFHKQPYQAKNNAGVGLFLSSNIIRKLHADMYIVSGNGVVHISPTDVTSRTITAEWQGTFVYVTIKLGATKGLNLQKMLAEFRAAADQELTTASKTEEKETYYFNVFNYFGRYAEEKDLAIQIRDKYIAKEVQLGKSLIVDFEDVLSAPHSFLNALLATSIRHLGMAAYKKIKIVNAAPEIRETIDFILDENTAS